MIKGLIMLLSVVSFLLLVQPANAQTVLDPTCSVTPSAEICQDNDKTRAGSNPVLGAGGLVSKVVDILFLTVGVISVFVIIIGGVRYITSSGDPTTVTGAKNTILYAVIALIIAVAARSLIIFVIDKL